MVVTDVSNLSVRDLTIKLVQCQKERGYAQSAIEQSVTFAKRLSRFMNERGFSNYTESIGSEFKKEMRKVYATGKFQMIQLFLSRLDDIHQNRSFLDFRKTLASIELPSELEMLCSAYMEHCRRKGNRKSTLEGNYKVCCIFLRGLCEKRVLGVSKIEIL